MDIQVELNQQEADRQARALAALLVESPKTRKRIRKVIKKEIAKARYTATRDVRGSLPNDPRKSYLAVKHSVWKKALGGSLSILSRRSAVESRPIDVRRKLDQTPHQRGGNRIPRSKRTEQLMNYYGRDRGFILRFLNTGTDIRTSRYGNRGSIAPRGFFVPVATSALSVAVEHIGVMIDQELAAAFAEEQSS